MSDNQDIWQLDDLEVGVSSNIESEPQPVGVEESVYSEVGEEVVERSSEAPESSDLSSLELGGENIVHDLEKNTEQSESFEEVLSTGVEKPSTLAPFEDIDTILSGLKFTREY